MSHLYRKQRAQTHRFRQSPQNEPCQSDFFLKGNNNSKGGNQFSLPIAYYFDGKEKKKIIRHVIDSYFEGGGLNPEIGRPTTRRVNPLVHTQKTSKTISITPYTQKHSPQLQPQPQIQPQPNSPILLKQLAKTTATRFFSHRSHIEQNNSNLPIIDQDDDGQPRRPQSQQKTRYNNSMLGLKRRQSAGFSPLKDLQIEENNSRGETLSKNSDGLLEDNNQSMTQSFVLSNNPSILSRGTTMSNRSYLKQFKYYSFNYSRNGVTKQFHPEGLFLLQRELRLKKYGALTLWQTAPHLSHQLSFLPHQPLSKQLYRKLTKLHSNELLTLLSPTSLYPSLFLNNCQQFRDLIIGLCKQLTLVKGRIIVNKITIQNVCRLGEKEVRVIDWSGAALRESVRNLDRVCLVKVTEPVLREREGKSERNGEGLAEAVKWICSPEYLAPEIVRLLEKGNLEDESLWDCPSASDIWSIGCLILQILTLVPLNATERYKISERNYCRRGLLRPAQFSYTQLLRRQKLLSTQALRITLKQCSTFLQKIDKRILHVMQRMLAYSPKSRIQPQQVIEILSK